MFVVTSVSRCQLESCHLPPLPGVPLHKKGARTFGTHSTAKQTKDLQQTEGRQRFQRLRSSAVWELPTLLYSC